MRRSVLLALLLVLTAATGSAQAGTLSGRVDREVPCFKGCEEQLYPRVSYAAAPGERNRVIVAYGRASVTVTDAGAPVDVDPEIRVVRSQGSGGRCEVLDGHSARCQFAFGLSFFAPGFSAFLGDGDDELEVDGGAPDVGTRLDGGSGDDRLVGGIGPDVFEGGSAGDVVDGGRGVDELSFAGRRAPVRLDVAAERFTSIERYIGGEGDDRMTGTDASETFLGGPGDDRLNGAGGEDVLVDGAGDDLLDGGPGDDKLSSQFGEDDGYPEYAETGSGGDDRLIGGDGDDVLTTFSGTDRLYGGSGDDRLGIEDYNALPGRGARPSGGPGDDRLEGGGTPLDVLLGGAGADRLVSRNELRDRRVDCGAGRDRVIADRRDHLRRCEDRRYSPRR